MTDPDTDPGKVSAENSESGPAAWHAIVASGFLAKALATDDGPNIYKAAIQFAALVRRGMTAQECRRATVELILEADEPTAIM